MIAIFFLLLSLNTQSQEVEVVEPGYENLVIDFKYLSPSDGIRGLDVPVVPTPTSEDLYDNNTANENWNDDEEDT